MGRLASQTTTGELAFYVLDPVSNRYPSIF